MNYTTKKETNSLLIKLDVAKPLYLLPRDPAIKEVLIPAMTHTDSLDCMIGFFSSKSLIEISPGLATYLQISKQPLRLIISPFLSNEDLNAINIGMHNPEKIIEEFMFSDLPDANQIETHTLQCLSWLIYKKRLMVKIAFMKDALFHSKVWIFKQKEVEAALHGSMNFTSTGFTKNREQLTLSRSWKGEEQNYHIQRLKDEFNELWKGGDEDCLVIDLPKAIEHKLIKEYKGQRMPTEQESIDAWRKVYGFNYKDESAGSLDYEVPTLKIPSYLDYNTGDYAHQGKAVNAWLSNNGRGILEMATGSGKTITAMIGASKLQERTDKLLVVISAPYIPLIEQWFDEVSEFGIKPINLTRCSGPKTRERVIKESIRRLRFGNSLAEILLISNDTLCSNRFIESISFGKVTRLLIADECHNLGAASFVNNPPEIFDYRLGLSATPIRQYDAEGTDALFKYFGKVCYEYTLEEAIGNCLTHYDYHVHFVELSHEEMHEWQELTNRISSLAWKLEKGEKDSYLDSLLRKRRLVLETAEEKILTLENLIDIENENNIKYTLIYGTDKDPEQLRKINQVLINRDIIFHQLTSDETSDRKKTSRILKSFQEGWIKVITAKRVLDEGVNIPQIKRAYILASTTVKRQWVQRRGRLLRKCKAIGKTHSIIHDFVTLPPDVINNQNAKLDYDTRRLIRSELERVWEFANLSRNAADDNGPYKAVQYLQKLANEL